MHYDAIIIGSGQGGTPLAAALAAAGRKTALVEREAVGGTCVNWGCTPTKTMVASARAAHLARRGTDFGLRQAKDVVVDMGKVHQRKWDMVRTFRGASERSLEATKGLDLVRGEARFVGDRTLEVKTSNGEMRTLDAAAVVIDTGIRTKLPPIEGLTDVPFLDNRTILELEDVPEHLLVLGGGYIGVEFAQMFRRFGAKVSVVQRGSQLLPREDADIAETLADILEEEGISLLLKTEARRIDRSEAETVRLSVHRRDGEVATLEGSHILVAAGRSPNTEALDPAAGGVELDERGYVKVDDRLATSASGVWAIGDVVGGPAFTHVSYDDHRVLKAQLLGEGDRTTVAGRILPYTVFTDPELGRVGMTEGEAREAGNEVRVASMPMSSVARALERDETRGLMKAVVDGKTDRILGAAVLGVDGGEVAAMFQIAMLGDLPFTALRDGMFAHPTLAESLNNLFTQLE